MRLSLVLGAVSLVLGACGVAEDWQRPGARGKADRGDGKGTERGSLQVFDLERTGNRFEHTGETQITKRDKDQTTVAAQLLRFHARGGGFRVGVKDLSGDGRLRFFWFAGDPLSDDDNRVAWQADGPSEIVVQMSNVLRAKDGTTLIVIVNAVCRRYDTGEVVSYAFEQLAVSEVYPVTETAKYGATIGLPCPKGALEQVEGAIDWPEDGTFGLFVFPVDLPSGDAGDTPYRYKITVELSDTLI